MIKFSARKNVIYILLLMLNHLIRKIILIIIGTMYPNSVAVFYSILMFLGEMSSGLILHRYQKMVVRRNKTDFIMPKKLKKSRIDSNFKIYSLLAISSFFDFMEMTLSIYISKFSSISKSLEIRLTGSIIIFSALIYCYTLKFPLFRHQICSLITVGICLSSIIISDGIFQRDKINSSILKYILLVLSSLLEMFFISMLDCIDKYLMEFNSINPPIIIIFEGLFGFIYCLISFADNELYIKFKIIISSLRGARSIGFFIFLLILIYVISGITNIYRVYTNKIYNPMTESLVYNCLNPLYMIYDFSMGNDFIIKGKRDYFYFFLNLILSIIISVTGLIFNEFIVVFCCGLERDTYQEISRRCMIPKEQGLELQNLLINDDKDENDDNSETVEHIYTIFV